MFSVVVLWRPHKAAMQRLRQAVHLKSVLWLRRMAMLPRRPCIGLLPTLFQAGSAWRRVGKGVSGLPRVPSVVLHAVPVAKAPARRQPSAASPEPAPTMGMQAPSQGALGAVLQEIMSSTRHHLFLWRRHPPRRCHLQKAKPPQQPTMGLPPVRAVALVLEVQAMLHYMTTRASRLASGVD